MLASVFLPLTTALAYCYTARDIFQMPARLGAILYGRSGLTKQLPMVIDLQRCVGCDACTVACKQERGLPVDITWNPVLTAGPVGAFPNISACYFPKQRMHCANAPCVDACPSGAIVKVEAGVVLINREDCNGCALCVDACPYDAVFMNSTTGLAERCTFCSHRVAKGLQPACVQSCIGKAMFFGDPEDP